MEQTTRTEINIMHELMCAAAEAVAKNYSLDAEHRVLCSLNVEGIFGEGLLMETLEVCNELNLWYKGVKFIADEDAGDVMICCFDEFDLDRNLPFMIPFTTKAAESLANSLDPAESTQASVCANITIPAAPHARGGRDIDRAYSPPHANPFHYNKEKGEHHDHEHNEPFQLQPLQL